MEALAIFVTFLFAIVLIIKLIPSRMHIEIEELIKRVDRLEKQLRSMKAGSATTAQPVVEQKAAEPASLAEKTSTQPSSTPAIVQPAEPIKAPVHSALPVDTPATPVHQPLDTDALERYVGQRVIGWAAVGLAIFAIGFFIKYAYDKGWIIPEGRVAIGELIGLGLMFAGWRQHRKGNALGSQMLLGCGIAACYLATYAAFGFYELISQPTAGIFMTVVMVLAGFIAVVTNAFSLGMLTVLGGLLTPLLLHADHDQHVSLFTYLSLLVASIYALYFWKPWSALRSLVWAGAMLHFAGWFFGYYSVASRADCLIFLGIMWLIPTMQILLHGQRHPTKQEDSIVFLVTPLIVFAMVSSLLPPGSASMRGKIAILLTLLYGAISFYIRRRQHDHEQYQLPLALSLIFLSITIPLELSYDWIGVGWVTQGVLLWGAGLRRSERLVRFFGLGTLLIGTIRIVTHDVTLHHSQDFLPFLNAQAIPGLWLSLGWALASWLAFRYEDRLKSGHRNGIIFSQLAFWLFWLVLNVELYPYCKSLQITTRWVAVAWMALAVPFFWWGCRSMCTDWRASAIIMMLLAVMRSLLNDLPIHRTGEFFPLINQASLPVLLTAILLLILRPIFIRYETVLVADEKHIKPISGLAALAMILLILSLDTYQFCVVNYPAQELLPHAVLSVVWALYGALLLAIGFWKHLATLRWAAIGIFGLTLAKVLLIDLSWLAGLYRILALLLIALVLAAVTWAYQRRSSLPPPT